MSIPYASVPSSRSVWHPATVALLVLAAIATRAQFFGNPIVYSDEDFYLLVGEKMLHGAIPYVDLWDRKPIGLFLLYAGMRLLGGNGVLAYQIVGTIFVAATALVIVRIGAAFSSNAGALAGGLAYIVWLNLGVAGAGQAPIFYNLLVSLAALITLHAVQGTVTPFGSLTRAGAAAMLLIGVAIQIKYSAVFEGIFFGIMFLVLMWQRHGFARCLVGAGSMVSLALLPTVLATAAYVASGHGAAFVQANFVSVFQRGGDTGPGVLAGRLAIIAAIVAPLVACAAWPVTVPPGNATVARRFVLLWLVAAAFGVVVFGTYLRHYLLPVLVPAAAGPACLFASRRGRVAAWVLIPGAFVLGSLIVALGIRNHGTRQEFIRIAQHIDPAGCLYVYSGEPAFYRATSACIPTRFAFPSHLSRRREARALGIDPLAEIARIMRTRPATVIVSAPYSDENFAARSFMLDALRNSYVRVLDTTLGRTRIELFRLRA